MTTTVPTSPGTSRADAAETARAGAVVCRYADLEPERGVAALVDGAQVAIFRLADGSVLAVGHRDPYSGANVIARGIVGTRGDVPTVASPMFKQVFDLRTGRALDDPAVTLGSYPVVVDAAGAVRVLPDAGRAAGTGGGSR